jgi:hypothetical protein
LARVSRLDQRPASGSCTACLAALGLASLKRGDRWYCSTACAEGRPEEGERRPVVPEPWLYVRPRRFFKRRQPRELRSSKATR